MEQREIKFNITVFEKESEMLKEDQELVAAAREAATRAYAKYSHFQVGAAILLAYGKIITGNNQENSAYPSGLCAERTTAFYASATFPGVPFKKIAITAINPVHPLDYPATPCGACRQVLSEYEHKYGKPIEVILSGQKGEIWKIDSIESLLPLSFGAEALPE